MDIQTCIPSSTVYSEIVHLTGQLSPVSEAVFLTQICQVLIFASTLNGAQWQGSTTAALS